jgi:hypothetical protein
VFEGEPKHNPAYIGLKNTFLLPHIGSAAIESRTIMGMVALGDIDAVLNGRPAPSLAKGLAKPDAVTASGVYPIAMEQLNMCQRIREKKSGTTGSGETTFPHPQQ